MNFSKTTVTNGVEILVGLTDMHTLTPIKVAAPLSGDPVIKAGTPVGADGSAANTADAVGILLYDVDTAANPNGTIVVQGVINQKKAEEHAGVTYDADALKTAVPGIVLRNNIGVNA